MTKIEAFQQAKRIALRVRGHATKASGLDTARNDKARITCSFIGIAERRFAPAILHFEALHGYYGDSSCYTDMDEDTGRYVAWAITEMGGPIMERAARLAEADAENARLAAADEAAAVLSEVSS